MGWKTGIVVASVLVWSCHPDELEPRVCCNFQTTVHHFEVLGPSVPENLELTIGGSWFDRFDTTGIRFVIPHDDDQAFEDCLNAIEPTRFKLNEEGFRRDCSRLHAFCDVDLANASEGEVITLMNNSAPDLSTPPKSATRTGICGQSAPFGGCKPVAFDRRHDFESRPFRR